MEIKKKKLDRHIKNELIKKGFIKRWLSDKSGYWYEKVYNKDPYKLKLYVDESYVALEIQCESIDIGKKRKVYETLCMRKFTANNLKKIMFKYDLD